MTNAMKLVVTFNKRAITGQPRAEPYWSPIGSYAYDAMDFSETEALTDAKKRFLEHHKDGFLKDRTFEEMVDKVTVQYEASA